MPSPLGHFGVAYMIHRLKKTLSLPALIVSSTFSDIDTLIYFLSNKSSYIGRELFHSFIGMGTLGTFISVLLTALVYPKVASIFFHVNKPEQKCNFLGTVVVSCLLGGFSHILIDSTCHCYNPLFYPFTRQSIDALLFTSDWRLSYAIVEILLLTMLLITLIVENRAKVKEFWKTKRG